MARRREADRAYAVGLSCRGPGSGTSHIRLLRSEGAHEVVRVPDRLALHAAGAARDGDHVVAALVDADVVHAATAGEEDQVARLLGPLRLVHARVVLLLRGARGAATGLRERVLRETRAVERVGAGGAGGLGIADLLLSDGERLVVHVVGVRGEDSDAGDGDGAPDEGDADTGIPGAEHEGRDPFGRLRARGTRPSPRPIGSTDARPVP